MIVFIRSSLIQRDVRALKYIHFLDKKEVKFIQWDRSNEEPHAPNDCITYRLTAGYGERLKSLGKFFFWNLFLLKTLFKLRNEIKIIQICDLDSYFPAAFFRLFGKKVVFDCYDFFTDSKISNTGTNIYLILYNFEMFCLRYVDLLILPLEVRKKHLNFIPENLFVCENVPHIKNATDSDDIKIDTSKLNIIYAGTLEEKNRGLEWIPEIASRLGDSVHFYVAGDGGLKNFFTEAAGKNSNITFMGPISHTRAMALQEKCDLIYSIYRSNLMNNVMAAPNKFYESTFVGTPIIINKGLYLTEIIEKNDIGFVVEETDDAVYELLKGLDKNEIRKVSRKTKEYWDNNYNDYVHNKYEREYKNHLAFFTNQ